MKWYLLSIGLITFVVYRSTKQEFNTQGVQNLTYSASQNSGDEKIIPGLVSEDEMYRNNINSFSKTAGVYKIKSNYKTVLCDCCGNNHAIFSRHNRTDLNKNILNGRRPEAYLLYGGFFQANSLLK